MTSDLQSMDLCRLLDRDKIRSVLFQYARGIDRRDADAVRDCYHPDAVEQHGTFSGSGHEFVEYVIPGLERFRVTSHNLCNMWIEVRGSMAVAETYFIAFHLLTGESSESASDLVMAGRYIDRFEKRAGVWKIAHRQLVCDYTRLSPSAEAWNSPLGLSRMRRQQRAPQDFVYTRWQELDCEPKQ
jgi:ketosteroid isomerase-like protein